MSSRRSFIKAAGTLAVASAIPSIGSAHAAPKGTQLSLKGRKITVNDQWDVIVVGGGPSGCTAAISAAREGAPCSSRQWDSWEAWVRLAWCLHGARSRTARRSSIRAWQRRYSTCREQVYHTSPRTGSTG